MDNRIIVEVKEYLDEFKKKGFHGTVSLQRSWTFYDGQITKIKVKEEVEESLDKNSKEFKELNK